MFDFRYLSTPLIGAVIGYFTNAVAIKMLFRPYNEVRIGRFRLPFTPGMIPKNRGVLAEAIGGVVSRELLNKDVIEQTLLSEEMQSKTGAMIDDLFEKWMTDERTVEDAVISGIGENHYHNLSAFAREVLAETLAARLKTADVGTIVAKTVMNSLTERAPSPIGKLLSPVTAENGRITIQKPLADFINRTLTDSADALMAELIDREINAALNASVADAAGRALDQKARIKRAVATGFEQIVKAGTERALEEMNIAGMIAGQISNFDSRQLEQLVFTVMDRELKGLIRLGGILGFVMGLVNIFFI